jgi:hypothetical protein
MTRRARGLRALLPARSVNRIMRGECYHPRAVSLALLIGRFD